LVPTTRRGKKWLESRAARVTVYAIDVKTKAYESFKLVLGQEPGFGRGSGLRDLSLGRGTKKGRSRVADPGRERSGR